VQSQLCVLGRPGEHLELVGRRSESELLVRLAQTQALAGQEHRSRAPSLGDQWNRICAGR